MRASLTQTRCRLEVALTSNTVATNAIVSSRILCCVLIDRDREYRHVRPADPAYFGGDVTRAPMTLAVIPDRKSRDTITLGATAWF
jgi:hypothetical protein